MRPDTTNASVCGQLQNRRVAQLQRPDPGRRSTPGVRNWSCAQLESGYPNVMISAIFDAILMVLGLILDIITLPFRLVASLLGGAEFEFQRFSRRRNR